MIGFFKKLFSRKTKPPFDILSDELTPVDINLMEKELNIRQHARRNGEMNIPKTSDAALDGPQERITAKFSGIIYEYLTKAQSKMQAFTEEIAAIDISLLSSRLEGRFKSFNESLAQTINENRIELVDLIDRHKKRKKELQHFRLDNDLHREPNYPDSKVYVIGLLLLITVIESLGNAYFFSKGAEHGYLGGTFFALLLALIDIAVVYNLGKRILWVQARETKHKTAGWIFLLGSIFWVLVFNLSVAHIREGLRISPVDWDTIALTRITEHPLTMTEMSSWILFALGILCSIGAIITGCTSDDRFPGYGRMHRSTKESRDDILVMTGEMQRTGISMKEQLVQEIDEIRKDADEKCYSISTYMEQKGKLVRNIERFARHNEDACNALIQIYRDENRIARSTKSPEYFSVNWQYKASDSIGYEPDSDRIKLAEQNKILKELNLKANDLSEMAQQSTDAYLQKIEEFTLEIHEENSNES